MTVDVLVLVLAIVALELFALIVVSYKSGNGVKQDIIKTVMLAEDRMRKRLDGISRKPGQTAGKSTQLEQAKAVADRWTEELESGEVPADLEKLVNTRRDELEFLA